MTVRLAAQESMLRGMDLEEKFAFAIDAGYDGIELQARGRGEFVARADELARAVSAGVVLPTACMNVDRFLGDPDETTREAAIADFEAIVDTAGEIGVTGIVTPNGCNIFSKYTTEEPAPLGDGEAQELLVRGLTRVGSRAAAAGVALWLEPLNRYEDYVVNTLEQARDIAARTGLANVGVIGDTFHMSIEEVDLGDALRASAGTLGHLQLGDSNRLEPGRGHLDWDGLAAALADIDYDGWLALECFLSGPPEAVLADAAAILRASLARASTTSLQQKEAVS